MTTVLITGAGGAVSVGLIRRLQTQYGYRVIGVDMDPHAVGLYWADKGFVIPPGGSFEFLPIMRRICEQEHVDVVVPLVDEELLPILELESDEIKVLLPRHCFVRTCLDKFYLMNKLAVADITVPAFTRLANDLVGRTQFPVIVKPRVGRGSRGIEIARSQLELIEFVSKSPYSPEVLIVQSYVRGTEFTVSVTVGRDGHIYAVVPKEIVRKRGVTQIAITRHNDRIDALCRKIQRGLRADGPFNVQLILDNESGLPVVFEINPRFSTTTSLTTEAGIDEVGWLIQRTLDPACPKLENDWKEGVVLLRRTLDEFVDEAYLRDHPITDMRGNTAC